MPRRPHPRRLGALLAIAAFLTASVTLSLSKGAPPQVLAAEASWPQLLVTTNDLLVHVSGERRQVASAGGGANGYRLLGAMPDGSMLVAYMDFGLQRVESIAPDLASRTIKTFGRIPLAFIAPSTDGFIAYDGSTQLLYRYDVHGSIVGSPMAPLGARYAIGLGDAVVAIGNGRVAVYDGRGRQRHATPIEGGTLVPMPGDRFAVTDVRYSEVRVYTKDLELKSTLRFPNRELIALAAGPDGGLAVVNGRRSCTNPDVEVDVFTDINGQPTGRTRTGVGTAVAVALGQDGFYVANAPCRRDDDSTIAAFSRDGAPRGITRILGTPTGVLEFAAAKP